jgi:hypothetical protein
MQMPEMDDPIPTTPPAEIPEDVLGERDLEARLSYEDIEQRIAEGRPPAEEDPRS